MKLPLRRLALPLLAVAVLWVAGCESTGTTRAGAGTNPRLTASAATAQLRPGDTLTIALLGIPDPSSSNVQIDEQGVISLPFIGNITAGGLTSSELSRQIRETYVSRQFYTTLDVSVTVTERFIYIGGEVQRPGRVAWSPDLTLSKAIQAAGGFTLYAKERAVSLSRDRESHLFDVRLAQRNPDEDPLLFPGDSIQVPRSPF